MRSRRPRWHNSGGFSGNKETEAKGKAREMGGKVEDKAGKAEKKIDDTLKS